MKRFVFLPALLLSCIHSFAQITITHITPSGNGTASGDLLQVAIKVTSTYQIDSAKASVLNRLTMLTYNSSTSRYEGSISLTGLVEGSTYPLAFDVVDAMHNHKRDTLNVVYDKAPVMNVDSPLAASVARPWVSISLQVSDMDSCNVGIWFTPAGSSNSTQLWVAKIKDSLRVTLNLGTWDGQSGYIICRAFDPRGGYATSSRLVYVEGSYSLQQQYASPRPILDFNYGRILISDTGLSNPRIINVNTNQQTIIPYRLKLAYPSSVGSNYVTPYGAIMGGIDSTNASKIWDWNAGNMYPVASGSTSFSLAGNYMVFMYYDLIRRNLSTRTQDTVSGCGLDKAVGPNGVVVFEACTSGYLHKYENGVVTTVTNYSAHNPDLVTDGTNILYLRSPKLHLLKGGTDTVLTTYPSSASPFAKYDYYVNNKWIAYNKPNTVTGQKQVWVRDSVGNEVQRSFFSTDSRIEALNPNGDVAFTAKIGTKNRRFISSKNGGFVEIGSDLGKVYYVDSNWYVAIGRILYKVDLLTPAPVKLLSFSASKKDKKVLLHWTAENEQFFDRYEVERSANGRTFNKIGAVKAINARAYSFDDNAPLSFNYYRLKMIDKDGSFTYSDIRNVKMPVKSFEIVPNPAGSYFRINSENIKGIRLHDQAGRMVLEVSGNFLSKNINVSHLPRGVYNIVITYADREYASHQKLILQ